MQVVSTPRGRGTQMNAGARRARGDVLLFLHADSQLPDGYDEAMQSAWARAAETEQKPPRRAHIDASARGNWPALQ